MSASLALCKDRPCMLEEREEGMSAIEIWKQRVAAHRVQSQKIRAAQSIAEGDRWEVVSSLFRANPRRQGDVEVNRLAREVTPDTTVLDVGGGAGRFALPLALRCRHVTVVEPSPSMGESLRQLAAEEQIDNISLVPGCWEEATAEVADVVLSAHVVYMIEDIRVFVEKLAAHARHKVLTLVFMHPPLARYAAFWRCVHGEEKCELPGAGEFLQVLWEMEVYPDLEMFEPRASRAFQDWSAALDTLRRRIHVLPDTVEDAQLQQAMRELLTKTPGGYVITGARPEHLALISWRPRHG
jgi:2-polyprenyl-3-methyl-5-hydroxy-6-metoxy-1,4-benzoquinol methylase